MISREPWLFHFTNALLFAIVCWLMVDTLLSRMASSGRNKETTTEVFLISGWWFASHPIHTEAVTSLVGRAEVLAAMFALLATKVIFGSSTTATKVQGAWWRWTLGALLLFATCLCKETAVVLPVIFAAADVATMVLFPKEKKQSMSNINLSRRAATIASVSMAYLLFRKWLFGNSDTGQTLALSAVIINFVGHLEGMNKLRTGIYIQAKYMKLLAWPTVLTCDYSLGVIEPVTSWDAPEMVFSAVVFFAVLTWACTGLMALRKHGDISLLLALGWTFGPLIPASHIVGIGTVMAERLLFLTSIGATMLICRILLWVTNAFPSHWLIGARSKWFLPWGSSCLRTRHLRATQTGPTQVYW